MYKTLVSIDGMMCPNCEKHMSEAFSKAFKIKKASSSHEKKLSEIISKEPLDEAEVKAVVEDAGYTFLGMTAEVFEKKGLF